MLFLLSPAKTLDETPCGPGVPAATAPAFAAEAEQLAGALAALPPASLRTLLCVSAPLAELNAKRYAAFATARAKQAAFAFDGPAYKALAAHTLTPEQLAYLQPRLRVLCGLYGTLRPLDAIKPYRLEMGAKLSGTRAGAPDLYAFWGDRLARALAADADALPAPEARCVVNVASGEYFHAVKPHVAALGCPVVTCVFPGPAVHAKAARGGLVRYAALTGATRPEQLKGFTGARGEWRFVPGESDDARLVFHRGAPSSAAPKKAPAKAKAKAEEAGGGAADDEEAAQQPAAKKRRAPATRACRV